MVLNLPSKPWKKVKAIEQTKGRFLLLVMSGLKDEADFQRMIQKNFEPCLGQGDELSQSNWLDRSILLITQDFDSFQKRLIFQNVMVELAN